MSGSATVDSGPWYRSLDRAQWKALIASNLGWTFDGFEVFALILTVGSALHQLLTPSEYKFIPAYAGAVIAITVFGWGTGGLLGGILADYIGRKRSMTLTILAYSLLTGLSALSWNWLSFAVFRFLVGLAIGSEWATGASITAELWPTTHAARAARSLQAGFPIGSIIASASGWPSAHSGPAPGATCTWSACCRRSSPSGSAAIFRNRRAGSNRTGSGVPPMTCGARRDARRRRRRTRPLHAGRSVRRARGAHRASILTFVMSLSVTIGYWGVSKFRSELCRIGRNRGRTCRPALGRLGRPGAEYRRPARLLQLRLSCRCARPQADDDCVLSACDLSLPRSSICG